MANDDTVNQETKGAQLLVSEEKTVNEDLAQQSEAEPEQLAADNETFEKQLERLESIVRQLEKGEISLEDSLKVFEEGVRLARLCSARLDEIQGKVEILLDQEHGEPLTKPLNAGSANASDWSSDT